MAIALDPRPKSLRFITSYDGLDKSCRVTFRIIDLSHKYYPKLEGWGQLSTVCKHTSRAIESLDVLSCLYKLKNDRLNHYTEIALINLTLYRTQRLIQFLDTLKFRSFTVLSQFISSTTPLGNFLKVSYITGMVCTILSEMPKLTRPAERQLALWSIASQVAKMALNIFEIAFYVLGTSVFLSSSYFMGSVYLLSAAIDLGVSWQKMV